MKKSKDSTLFIIIKIVSCLLLIFLSGWLLDTYVTLRECSYIVSEEGLDSYLDRSKYNLEIWQADAKYCESLPIPFYLTIISFIVIVVETIMLFLRKKYSFGFGIFAYTIPLLLFGFLTLHFILSLACLILVVIVRKNIDSH